MIKYNYNNINDWNLGDSNLIKVYRHNAICYYKVVAGETAQTPCYAVVDDITQYQDTEFENVFNKADNKWYKLNNLNEYEEYGVYGSGRTECSGGTPTECVTTYEGKLTIDEGYEYQYSGNSWNNVGEISGSSRLPQGYTEVEYIQNYPSLEDSSTQAYIDTGFKPNQDTRLLMTMKCDISNTYSRFCGAGGYDLADGIQFDFESGAYGTLHISWGGNTGWNVYSNINGDMDVHTYDWNKNSFYMDETLVDTVTTSFTCVYPMGIFTATREENDLVDLNETIYGTLYSCQIYDNGTLVRDFVPCINPSNVVGVYDVVNDVFYGSANNNNFVAGSAVTPSSTVYPVYYDEIQDPPTQVSFSSMTEAEQYECPYVGLMATINGDLYVFNDNYEWEAIPFTLSGTTSSPSAFTLTINDTSVPTRILSDNGDGTYNWGATYLNPITDISGMCSGNTALTSFDWGMSDTSELTTFGDKSFYSATSLSSITIPNSVTTIGNASFRYCSGLTSIDIPSSVTSIGEGFLFYCKGITNVDIPDSVTTISDNAFYECTSLSSCTIGSGVTSIGNFAFTHCSNLTSITIPNSVTSIGGGAFSFCDNLSNISIGSGLTSFTVGFSSFMNCHNISAITVDSENTTFDSRNNCNAIIQTSTNKLIKGANTTVIPSGVTSIDDYAFRHCSGLTSIDVPNSVTRIGWTGFYGCSGATSCTIGSGITYIDSYAFQDCTSLTSITINATTPPTLGDSVFSNTNECPILVPSQSVETYKAARGWSNYSSRIQAKPSPSPSSYKFQATYSDSSSYSEECDSSTELTSASTKPSGYVASAMTTAVVGDCITSLGTDAFRDCSGLTSITLPSGLTSIGENSIRSCTSLSSITIPDSVTTIGDNSFRYCISLTSINIPSGVTTISDGAFSFCRGLTSITIPDSVTSIGNSGFCNCSAATSINIGSSVTSIGNFAFGRITGVTSLNIPNNVTSIGYTSFRYCNSLTSVTIGSGVTSIGSNAFSDCTSLTSITINATTPPTLGSTAFNITNNCPIYVPSASVEAYKAATNWSTYASRIQAIP